MAKKQSSLDDIFKRTEPGAPPELRSGGQEDLSDFDAGTIHSTGVGLRMGEIEALDQIAAELGISRNALLHYAVRWFLVQHRRGLIDLAGAVEIPPPPKKRLRLPGK